MNCPHCGVLLKNVVIHLKSGWEYCDPCHNCLRVIKWGRSHNHWDVLIIYLRFWIGDTCDESNNAER
jgi:hypothetical protein